MSFSVFGKGTCFHISGNTEICYFLLLSDDLFLLGLKIIAEFDILTPFQSPIEVESIQIV